MSVKNRFSKCSSTAIFVFHVPPSQLSAKQRAGWLGTWIDEEGREIYKSLNWADRKKEDPTKILNRFASYIKPRETKLIACHCFNRQGQVKVLTALNRIRVAFNGL